MKVKDLIEQLQKMPNDADIIVSIDEEGNGFTEVMSAVECLYDPDDVYYGPIPLDSDYEDSGFPNKEEWELEKAKRIPCVVLW